MKKSIAILIVALLVLPMLTFVSPVAASTGHERFGAATGGNTAFTLAVTSISVKAGTMDVVLVDGTPSPGNFTILMNATGFPPVDFSGAVFDLYMSKDGYSTISAGDVKYAGSFQVSDLDLAGLKAVNVTNSLLKGGAATFYIGTIGTTQALVGPIPFDITNDYKYIKVYDGSAGSVAVAGIIDILPSFSFTPTSGPGGMNVCVSGVALAPNTTYNVTYSNSTIGAAQVTTGADGKFSYCWNIKDLCTDWNEISGPSVPIYIDIWNNATATFIDEVTYDENARVILSLISPSDTFTGPTGNLSATVDVNVLQDLIIAGNWFNPTAAVNVVIGTTTVATITTNGTGFFNQTITVPVLSLGLHNVTLSNAGCKLMFTINVLPTLVITPEEGPVGTSTLITAYGFPANSVAYIYYEAGACDFDYCYFWVANATVGADGQFNVTVPWVIPNGFGGDHYVEALDTFYLENQTCAIDWGTEIAYTTFYVTPTIWVTPSTIDNDGTIFSVMGTGLDPDALYTINIDNLAHAVPDIYESYGYDTIVVSDECGGLELELVAAGFAPGLHAVALTNWDDTEYGVYPVSTYTTFSVSTVGDPVATMLVSMSGDIVTIKTATGTMQTTLDAIGLKVTSINGTVATIQTDLGTLTGTVTAMNGDVATIKTQVGTINAKVATFTPTDMMPVWIAVIFAIIAAIASIYGVLVIRSKIAQ